VFLGGCSRVFSVLFHSLFWFISQIQKTHLFHLVCLEKHTVKRFAHRNVYFLCVLNIAFSLNAVGVVAVLRLLKKI